MVDVNLEITADEDDGRQTYDIGAGAGEWAPRLAYGSDGYFLIGRRTDAADRDLAGLRFESVSVPQGATISAATLTLTQNGAVSGTAAGLTCHADDVDDAAAWGAASYPLDITPTTASASGSMNAGGAGSTITFDVASIVQELVDRGGWTANNAMRFVVDIGTSYTYSAVQIADVDNATYSAAQLDITYADGGGSTKPKTLTLLGVG